MGAIKKIIYDCRQATMLIEKRQHVRLTIGEWCKLMIHLAGCAACRLFRRQSRLIKGLMQQIFHQRSTRQFHLDEQAKQKMQQMIDGKL